MGGALALLAASATSAEMLWTHDKIHPGVQLNGIDLGGLSPEDATSRLAEGLTRHSARQVSVAFEDQVWTLDGNQLGLHFDLPDLVERAMEIGRQGSLPEIVRTRARAWVNGIPLDATPSAKLTHFGPSIEPIAKVIDQPPVDASASFQGTQASVSPAKLGRLIDRKSLETGLLAALSAPPLATSKPVELIAPAVPPKVTDDQARAAAEQFSHLVTDPLKVTYNQKSWSFGLTEFKTWLRFSGTGDQYALSVDPDAARGAILEQIGPSIDPLAQNARFKVVDGVVTIIPSKAGLFPDMNSFASDVTPLLTDASKGRSVTLKTVFSEPGLTTERAQSFHIKDRLSTYSTSFPAGNLPRVNNIYLLTDSLDGKLVGPGEVFSFNGAVGRRTAAKGYKEAPAIVDGKLKPAMGGGICQVGTTLFNTIFESGLPVVERYNHSLYISHYPTGRDATVSWGGPDLKFKNDTAHWVLVSTSHTPGSVKIELWGTNLGYTVTSELSGWYGVKPSQTVEVRDPSLPAGVRKMGERGQTGRSCHVVRVVRKDGALVRRDTFISTYPSKKTEVRVGSRVVSSSPSVAARRSAPNQT